jgi:hypothetical protein
VTGRPSSEALSGKRACLRWPRDRFELSEPDARCWLGVAMAWEIA